MKSILCAVALGCLLSNAVNAQQTKSSLEFKAAEMTDGGIAFEPVFPIDWEQVARTHFHLFDIDRPDRTQISKHFFEPGLEAPFTYEAPLPTVKTPSFYYALTESRIVPVNLEKLLGEIAYPSDQAATQVGPPKFSGKVSARPSTPQKISGAGFVLIADKPLTFHLSEVAVVTDEDSIGIAQHKVNEKTVTYVYNDGQGHHALLGEHSPKFPGVKNAYLASVSGEPNKYLFVDWAPDNGVR